mgnify:CR=1 FL=1
MCRAGPSAHGSPNTENRRSRKNPGIMRKPPNRPAGAPPSNVQRPPHGPGRPRPARERPSAKTPPGTRSRPNPAGGHPHHTDPRPRITVPGEKGSFIAVLELDDGCTAFVWRPGPASAPLPPVAPGSPSRRAHGPRRWATPQAGGCGRLPAGARAHADRGHGDLDGRPRPAGARAHVSQQNASAINATPPGGRAGPRLARFGHRSGFSPRPAGSPTGYRLPLTGVGARSGR